MQGTVCAWLARRDIIGRCLGHDALGDEAARPEGDVGDEGDEERDKVEDEEVHLCASEEAVETLGELDSTIDGTDLGIVVRWEEG